MLHQETKHAEENVDTCVLRTIHIKMYIVFKNDSLLKDNKDTGDHSGHEEIIVNDLKDFLTSLT